MSPGPTVRSAFRVLLLVIGSVAASAASPVFAAQPDGHVVKVTVTSSRVSLTARETPLVDVLAAIGRQAGVKMVLRGDLNASVTEVFADVPLDEGIRRLSRWHSVVLIYAPSPDRSEDAVLIEARVTASAQTPGPAGQAAGGTPRNDAPVAAGRSMELNTPTPDAPNQLKHRNPAVRVQGIQALVREQGDLVPVDALREIATRDPSARVRLAAIRGLTSLNSAAAGDALDATLADHDAAIRAAARSALARWRHRFLERRDSVSDDGRK